MLDLLKLLVIMGLTVALLLKKWDLGLVLLLDAGVVAVLFGYPPLPWLRSVGRGLVAPDTLSLAGAVFLVLTLAELMRRTRAIERMVGALQRIVPDSRMVLALLPMLIGLMPMLGGAMVSAPMVNAMGSRLGLSADRKTYINYWFRHSMEYVFPLYSSLLMIAALTEVSVYAFIRVSWPLSVAALVAGATWGLLGVHREPGLTGSAAGSAGAWRDLLGSIWPLALVVLTVVVFKFNMMWSLVGVIVLFAAVERVGPSQWKDVVTRSFPIHTFSAIFGVMLFKQVLVDAGAVARIPPALRALGLPPLLVAFAVPMLAGLLTGTAAATLALSVPLVMPLLDPLAIGAIPAGVWMFVGGFGGVLLSPMHLCLALTQDYFDANWRGLYRAIVPSVGLVVAVALGIVLL